MPNRITVTSVEQLGNLEQLVKDSAAESTRLLRVLLGESDGLDVLSKLRFDPVGRDPLDGNRPLNFVEQLNQTFSHLVSIRAAEFLLKHHADSAPFILALGPISGYDIVSADGAVAAEVFAAVSPDSNNKLKKDIDKLVRSGASHKYVFYYCPGYPREIAETNGIKTISLGQI